MKDREDLEEFVTIPAVESKNSKDKHGSYSKIMEACREKSDRILREAMVKNTNHLLDILQKNEDQNDGKRARIYPLLLKENQLDHLPIYFELLENILNAKIADEKKPYLDLKQDDIMITRIGGTDVRDITLKIYLDSEEATDKPVFKLYIYFIEDVADLSENNMYVFSKAITNKNFIAIVPTFQTFDDDTYQGIDRLNYQKYVNPIYDSKTVFCSYFLECLTDPLIKAYLPPQAYRLITDMDYYCLGYSQSCRRLNYVIERCLYLNPNERPNIESTNIKKVIDKVQGIIKHKIKYYQGYRPNFPKIIKIIINQKQKYVIPQQILAFQLQMREKVMSQSQDQVINQIHRSLCKELSKINPIYDKILNDQHYQNNDIKTTKGHVTRKKKDRADCLGINFKPNATPKVKLEEAITRLLKSLTFEIRNFAATINWKNVKFEERISPCIPFKIVSSMKEEDENAGLVEEVASNFTTPFSNLLNQFPQDQIGYGLYLIKTLQLSGLFNLSKREINPLVSSNFFEKSRYDKSSYRSK